MIPVSRSGTKRTLVSAGVLMGISALLTAAAVTGEQELRIPVISNGDIFNLVAAGSSEPGWTPTEDSWAQASPEDDYRIQLTSDGSGYLMAPGSTLDVRIAVKNNSSNRAGEIELTIVDPWPRGEVVDPVTGNYLELFDYLNFTIRDGATLLADAVPGKDLRTIIWPGDLPAGEQLILDVAIHMPNELDNRWQMASTDLTFSFEGINP